MFIVGMEKRKGPMRKVKAWKLNHCPREWDQSHVLAVLGKSSVGKLPAERDLFDSYHLPKTGSDRDLRSVRKKGFAVKINLYLLKMSS